MSLSCHVFFNQTNGKRSKAAYHSVKPQHCFSMLQLDFLNNVSPVVIPHFGVSFLQKTSNTLRDFNVNPLIQRYLTVLLTMLTYPQWLIVSDLDSTWAPNLIKGFAWSHETMLFHQGTWASSVLLMIGRDLPATVYAVCLRDWFVKSQKDRIRNESRWRTSGIGSE